MEITEEILKLLRQGIRSQKEMASRLGVKRSTVSKHLVRMESQGVLRGIGKTLGRYYEIIPENERVKQGVSNSVSNAVSNSNQSSQSQTINTEAVSSLPEVSKASKQAEASQAYRNHATYIEYPLESYDKPALSRLCQDKGINFKEWAISNNYLLSIFRPDGFELRLSNRCIVIVPPDALLNQSTSLPFNITQFVLTMGFKVAKEAESLYKLKVRQIGGLYMGALVRQELAQTNNPLAKNILDKKKEGEITIKERTFRIIDPDTDRKCFEFDDSPGEWYKKLKEAEATDPLNADNHATTVHIMLDDVLHKNAWQNIADSLKHISGNEAIFRERTDKIEALLTEYGQKLNVHLPVLESQTKANETQIKLNEAMLSVMNKQASLEAEILSLKQAKPAVRGGALRRLWEKIW